MPYEPKLLVDGLHFPEAPRWRDDKLWFSDMHAHRVMTADLHGRAEVVASLATQPSGLGWTPDGRLLVVSMTDRRLLCLDGDTWTEVADLSQLAASHCNDMVVDDHGRAYVGTFGFELHGGKPYAPGQIILVMANGDARVVADDLAIPNGAVITPDGRTLIVAETMGFRLSAFDIESDGSLSSQRVWAQFNDATPDGICLDAEGAVWIASPVSSEVLRVHRGSEITHRVKVSNHAFACMLGGPDGKTLFALTATSSDPGFCRAERTGRIETIAVDVPACGTP